MNTKADHLSRRASGGAERQVSRKKIKKFTIAINPILESQHPALLTLCSKAIVKIVVGQKTASSFPPNLAAKGRHMVNKSM
jgi:hypothetical protein